MDAPTSAFSAEKSLSSDGDAVISRSVDQRVTRSAAQIGADAERIMSSVARLTSNSINGLEGLSSELQKLQEFLKSEVGRVHGEIESAMAGMKIIVETIGLENRIDSNQTLVSFERPRQLSQRCLPTADRLSWRPGQIILKARQGRFGMVKSRGRKIPEPEGPQACQDSFFGGMCSRLQNRKPLS